MATIAIATNARVWEEILDLENSNNKSGSHQSHKKSLTKDDKLSSESGSAVLSYGYGAGILQRGDTVELSMKDSSRPRKKDKRRAQNGPVGRRSATRESRGERARSLSRGLGRSLSKLRSRSKSALRRATTDKSKKKSTRKSDINEQPQPSVSISIHSTEKTASYPPPPDRSTSGETNTTHDEDDSIASDTLDHDGGKKLIELFERQQKEFQSEMLATVARFDKEAKYWKKKANALKMKYEGVAENEKDLRALTLSVFDLECKIKVNETESGEKIDSLENRLRKLGEEKDVLQRKLDSSSQQAIVLEQQVKDRESSISQLRHVMKKAEEDSESRIELLERQLDKLVEMKSRRSLTSQTSTASTAALSMSQTSAASHTSHHTEEGSHKSGEGSEVKNLEALLVRILAEKDKLAFENENLRALVAQREPSSDPVAPSNLKTYKLSCRNCIDQSFVGKTRDNVKQKVRDHFNEVWYVTRGIEVGDTDETFMTSSFAQHIAGHCKNCQSLEEVVTWCVKHIKVEKISRKYSVSDSASWAEKEKSLNF